MKFSVLMSVYYKEDPAYLNQALESVWNNQTVKPNEIVLVEDGVLSGPLYQTIEEWKKKLDDLLKVIVLETNQGLAYALNKGIEECNYTLVARMDSDDIAASERFQKQIEVFKKHNVDVCGSCIEEFEFDENKVLSYRSAPQDHEEIIHFSKRRCPFNHMTVMYKKEAVISAGGYSNQFLQEDYHLWSKMILNEAKLFNHQDCLVKVRVGNGMLQRRRGWHYALSELRLQIVFLKSNFVTTPQFLTSCVTRLSIRLLPVFFVKIIYTILRKL